MTLVINRSSYRVIGCTYYTEEIQFIFTHRIASISSSFSANRFSASWRKLASSADRRWARCSSALRPCNPQHQLVSNTWHEDQLIYLGFILKEFIQNWREDYKTFIVINVGVCFKITFWFIHMFENTTVIFLLIVPGFFVLELFYLSCSLFCLYVCVNCLLIVCSRPTVIYQSMSRTDGCVYLRIFCLLYIIQRKCGAGCAINCSRNNLTTTYTIGRFW